MSRTLARGAAAAAAACVALAGCSAAPPDDRPVLHIAEAAKPTPTLPLATFLPDSAELATTLGTGAAGFLGHPVLGRSDVLLRSVGLSDVTPPACAGAAYRLQHAVYDGSPVQSVATNSWAGGGFDGPPVSGFFGVVQMTSAVAAQRFFTTMSEQWRHCDGQTLARHQAEGGADELSRITGVSFGDRVLSASVLRASGGSESPTGLRAVGLAGDCIAEVEVTDPRPGADTRDAIGVADLILGKIAAHR